MAALALLEDLANGRFQRKWIFRDQQDLMANDDKWLMNRFQLPRAVLLDLRAIVGPALQRSTAETKPCLSHINSLATSLVASMVSLCVCSTASVRTWPLESCDARGAVETTGLGALGSCSSAAPPTPLEHAAAKNNRKCHNCLCK